MALVWKNFVNELRARWDLREALPNMNFVPGLDSSPEELNAMRRISTLGLKADNAAFVNSSEPDPDDGNCLIGQKLQVSNYMACVGGNDSFYAFLTLHATVYQQVFNIGIESTVALEMLEIERMERQHREESEEEVVFVADEKDRHDCAASAASTEIMNNATEKDTKRNADSVRVVDTLPNKRSFGAIAESPEDDHHSRSRGSTSKDEFHDAHEGRSLLGSTGTADEDSLRGRMDFATSVTQRQNRKGARCPVHGVSLVASGDQLYAPYLQRPSPVTDDLILERRMMLSPVQRTPKSPKIKVHDRIEIAHRLQRPKLLSDMRAFKAANPGAVFADFTKWYGNPGSPLDDYGREETTAKSINSRPGESKKLSTAVKLDNASEAIQILTAMRDFWSKTWDEAIPCAAVDQEPLFDAFSTVEMLLDSLETMHPASLVNQIMAVNLSSAYFTLVSSAGDTLHVGMVTSALQQLRVATEHALLLLSRDVTNGTSSRVSIPEEAVPRHASLEAIRACDNACNALSVAEASIARATSILHKFPRQYDLVQNMLRRADGEPIAVTSSQGQSGILRAIHEQQTETHPRPVLREYILRNTDEDNPCQLCVRYGDEGASDENGGVLLALTKCCRD